MKKYFALCLTFIAISFCFTSCEEEETDPTFISSDLEGYWISGTEYYHFKSDGTGATWDTSDDCYESDITYKDDQSFDWHLSGSTLTLTNWETMVDGSGVKLATRAFSKLYTITTLNSSTLVYKDDYVTYTYTKTTNPE